MESLSLSEVFSVPALLQARGLEVGRKGNGKDLLLTNMALRSPKKLEQMLFEAFQDDYERAELLDWVLEDKPPRSTRVSELTQSNRLKADRQRFSTTFEWFVGEMMVRRFGALSSAYGVHVTGIQRNTTGNYAGDYDSLVVLRNTNLAYFECKTGGFNREAMLKCLERGIAIHCEFSAMMVDAPFSEAKLVGITRDARHPVAAHPKLRRVAIKEVEESAVYEWGNCYFLSSRRHIEAQLRTVLRVNEARKAAMLYQQGPDDYTLHQMGYDVHLVAD